MKPPPSISTFDSSLCFIVQFSVGAGLGVEFMLSNHLGLYLDPGFNYYFPCNQPRSIRTEKPLMLNFDVGLRFNF